MNQFDLTLKLEEAKAANTQKKLKEVYDSVMPVYVSNEPVHELVETLKVAKEIHNMCLEKVTNMKAHYTSHIEQSMFNMVRGDIEAVNKLLFTYKPPIRQFTSRYWQRGSYNPLDDNRQPLFAKLMAIKAMEFKYE